MADSACMWGGCNERIEKMPKAFWTGNAFLTYEKTRLVYKKEEVVSRQPTIFIVNLKSNTMKNTVQMYDVLCYTT
jgi:hypothetical protein